MIFLLFVEGLWNCQDVVGKLWTTNRSQLGWAASAIDISIYLFEIIASDQNDVLSALLPVNFVSVWIWTGDWSRAHHSIYNGFSFPFLPIPFLCGIAEKKIMCCCRSNCRYCNISASPLDGGNPYMYLWQTFIHCGNLMSKSLPKLNEKQDQ